MSSQTLTEKEVLDELTKYNVPCKYFLTGTCRLGDVCRFRHEKLKETGDRKFTSLENLRLNLNQAELALLSRKPILHMVVLFAADVRVRHYAEEMEEIFLSKGINVFLQTELEDLQYIKPENLLELITGSAGDYLVVIGDRNMKNKTCHTKKSGKLVEISIDDRVNSILHEWSLVSNSSGKSQLHTDIYERNVDELTKAQLQELIQTLTGLKHLGDRMSRLKKTFNELKSWKSQKGSSSIYKEEKTIKDMTGTQNAAIKLHKELVGGLEILQSLEVVNIEEGKIMRGVHLRPTDKPIIPIHSALKEKLVQEFQMFLPQVERLGAMLSEITNNQSLWDAYMTELKVLKEKPKAVSIPEKTKSTSISNNNTFISSTNTTHPQQNLKNENLNYDVVNSSLHLANNNNSNNGNGNQQFHTTSESNNSNTDCSFRTITIENKKKGNKKQGEKSQLQKNDSSSPLLKTAVNNSNNPNSPRKSSNSAFEKPSFLASATVGGWQGSTITSLNGSSNSLLGPSTPNIISIGSPTKTPSSPVENPTSSLLKKSQSDSIGITFNNSNTAAKYPQSHTETSSTAFTTKTTGISMNGTSNNNVIGGGSASSIASGNGESNSSLSFGGNLAFLQKPRSLSQQPPTNILSHFPGTGTTSTHQNFPVVTSNLWSDAGSNSQDSSSFYETTDPFSTWEKDEFFDRDYDLNALEAMMKEDIGSGYIMLKQYHQGSNSTGRIAKSSPIQIGRAKASSLSAAIGQSSFSSGGGVSSNNIAEINNITNDGGLANVLEASSLLVSLGASANSSYENKTSPPIKSSSSIAAAAAKLNMPSNGSRTTSFSGYGSNDNVKAKITQGENAERQICDLCQQESTFECNFCGNLRRKGVDIAKAYFCSDCIQKAWKDHHKIHERLSLEFKHLL